MRKITLDVSGGSTRQYSTLVLELNSIAKSWARFGVKIKLPGQDRIIDWGTKSHDDIRSEVHD